jgi:GNAT superfamily N-acetyltransferase
VTLRPTAADINRFFRGATYGEIDIFSPRSYARFVRAHDLDLARAVNRFDGTKLIGTLVYGVRGERAWFALIGVDASQRGAGLGGELVDAAIAQVRARGVRSIELEIVQRNAAARALVAARGFTPRESLLVYGRRAMRGTSSRHAARVFTAEQVAEIARTRASCWQREPRSVAGDGALALVRLEGAYAFARVHDDGSALLLDAGAASEQSAHALLDELDRRIVGAITLNNERAGSPLAAALAQRRWRVVERQHRFVLDD